MTKNKMQYYSTTKKYLLAGNNFFGGTGSGRVLSLLRTY